MRAIVRSTLARQTVRSDSSEADRPLSYVDAAWLRMDSPTNIMVITIAMLFESALSYDQVSALIEERLLRSHPRFRQRVVPHGKPFGRPTWQTDPEFDLRVHIDRRRLPKPGDDDALAELIGSLASSPLPLDRPLWHASLVEGVAGGTCVVFRIHHCVADGIALVRLFSEICDSPASDSVAVGQPRRKRASNLREYARQVSRLSATLGRLLLLPSDPATPLKQVLGHRKVVAWSDPIQMSEVHRLATAVNGTANDILQSCVAGSVARYLEAVDGLPGDGELRTLVPMFLQGEEHGLGNHFGLVFLSLPLRSMEPLARVHAVQERMRVIKAGEDATVAFAALDVLGMMSPGLEQRALGFFTDKASLLTTNVPGPPAQSTLAGHVLKSLLVWAPTSGHLGIGFTLVSYAGTLRLGVCVDDRLVSEPRWLARAFSTEFAKLSESVPT